MDTFNTLNRHGYSVRFSPFNPNCLAVASSENFGLKGKGTLFILNVNPSGSIQEIKSYYWSDGLFDVAWSQLNANCLLTASGDGSLQLWDLNINVPIKVFQGHRNEISSIDLSCKDVILSASWDTSIKLWDPHRSICLNTFLGHSQIVHEAKISVHIPNLFASVAEDGNMKLWNTSSPNQIASFRVHDNEVLSCDWCKHDAHLIATCGSDSLIRGWDIRSYKQPVFQLKGSNRAIKRVRFSPHNLNILASVSFDCSTKIWNSTQSQPLEVFEYHSDFVYGLDWNFHKLGVLADCSWDHTVRVFTSETLKNVRNKM